MQIILQRFIAFFLLITVLATTGVQAQADKSPDKPTTKEAKPYKILTTGRQITIKSTKEIKHVMLWTIGGNRVVEQRDLKSATVTIDIPVNQKTFYLMIGLTSGKVYTESIGVL